MVESEYINNKQRLILSPNHSATWKQTKRLIWGIAAASTLVALYWISIGAWVVLPFIGLEIIALFWLSRMVCASSYAKDVLEIDDNNLKITHGLHAPEVSWEFKLADTELVIIHPTHSLSPHILKLHSQEQCIPLAPYLNKADMDLLIHYLKESKLPYRYTGQTQTTAIDAFENKDQ